jgi:hypothetical protein
MGNLEESISFCVDRNSGLALPANQPYRHEQGHLRVDANVTIASVLDYYTADGKKLSVLRHPDQVFHPLSLQSLTGLPITISHPMENDNYVMVTPENFRKYGHGVTGDEVEDITLTSPYVRIKGLNFQTKDSLTVLKQGNKELSPGYFIKRIPEDGIFDNTKYTHRQYGYNVDSLEPQDHITYNHLAVMDVGENGRSGNTVKVLNLDSADVLISTGEIKKEHHTKYYDMAAANITKDSKKMKRSITVDLKGVQNNYEVDEAGLISIPEDHINQLLALVQELKAAADQTKMEDPMMPIVKSTGFDSVQAVCDGYNSLKGQVEVLKTEAAKAPTVDTVTVDTKVINSRLSLILDGLDLIPDATKESLIAMDSREIQEQVIKEWKKDILLEGLPDATVDGMYSVAKTILDTVDGKTKDAADSISLNADSQANRGSSSDTNMSIRDARIKGRNRNKKVTKTA